MISKVPLFVELCAGLASVSLMLQGGKYARPPVSRLGNKHGYALALLRIMGLRPGQGADRYLWCEPNPGCRALLHAYTDREVMREAARWGWLRRRSHGSGPGEGFRDSNGDGRPGQHFAPDAPAAAMGRAPTLPATITPDARAIEPADLPPGTVVYMDPPYVGTTGYGNDLPRSEVVSMARRWADAGARVASSEAEPIGALVDDGWFTVEITSQRIGQKRTFSKQQREWVTCSHEPAWRPAEQADLFGC